MTKRVVQKISQNKRGRFAFFAVFQRVVDGTEGHRGDRGLLRRQGAIERASEGTGGHSGKKSSTRDRRQ